MGVVTQRMRMKGVEKLPFKGPARFNSVTEARAVLNTPADANYVLWNPAWPVARDLEDVFNSLAANDILVLPERAEPYVVDSSEGFRAAGVQSVTGRYGNLPIVNQYKGIRNARTWFAMARARRGILGLGPNARIVMSSSSWTQEPQIEDAGSVQSDGWTSPGRRWTNTSGVLQGELVGCQEKVIEAAHASPYFGNFTLESRDLGGVAYSGLVANGAGASMFERLQLTGAWRGFLGVPNGESGAISVAGNNTYTISKCIMGTRDSTGTRVASSPIMINSSPGGHIIDTDACESFAGMLTIWRSSGLHRLTNVNCRFNWGPGINLEDCRAGFQVEWNGGSIWSDYNGNGGKTPKPADQSNRGRLHIHLNSPGGSSVITLRGVDIDRGPQAGSLCIQSYGTTLQQASDITCYDKQGASVPVRVYS